MGIKNKVLCSECGFLCWTRCYEGEAPSIHEMSEEERSLFHTAGPDSRVRLPYCPEHAGDPMCLRRGWILGAGPSSGHLPVLSDRSRRRCKFFLRYRPGYSPEAHKELLRDAETRQAMFKAAAISALVGGIVATAGYFAYGFFLG